MWELPSEPCARAVPSTAQLWVWGICCPSPPCPLLSTQGLFSSTPCIINKLQLEDSTHRGWEQLALLLVCAWFLFLLHQGSHNPGVHPLLLCSGDEPSLIPSHPFPKSHLLPVAALPQTSPVFCSQPPVLHFPKANFELLVPPGCGEVLKHFPLQLFWCNRDENKLIFSLLLVSKCSTRGQRFPLPAHFAVAARTSFSKKLYSTKSAARSSEDRITAGGIKALPKICSFSFGFK